MITLNWQLLILISVLAQTALILLQRNLLKDNEYSPTSYAVINQWLVTGLFIGAALFMGFDTDFSKLTPAILIIPLIYSAGVILRFRALSEAEASNFAIIFNTKAIWTMLIGLFLLGESYTGLELLGVILVLIASYIAVYEGGRLTIHKVKY